MLDAFTAVLSGLIAGGIGGFLYSFVGWAQKDDGTQFLVRKNVSATFLGIIGGLALAIAQASTLASFETDWQLLVQLVTLLIAGAGTSAIVPKAIGAASKRQTASAKTG